MTLGGAGGKRSFLKGGFAVIGFGGLRSLSNLGELNGVPGASSLGGTSNDQIVSLFDWDLSSAA